MKHIPLFSIIVIVFFTLVSVVTAGGWTKKVTGGGELDTFYLTVSATEQNGVARGQYEVAYWSSKEKEHGAVSCIWISEDETRAVVVAEMTINQAGSWDYPSIAFFIEEGGRGYGDKANGFFEHGQVACDGYENDRRWGELNPVIDGNFNIRTR